MKEETFNAKDGLALFYRYFPAVGTTRAVVIAVHGFKSHGGLFGWAAEQMAKEGLACYALDLRGNGRSDGERYYVRAFDDYMDDLSALHALVKSREGARPVFMLGHSAGGVIAANYALAHQGELSGCICESFALDVGVPDAALAVLSVVGHLLPRAGILALEDEAFSRDPGFVERMKADPLINHTRGPIRTVGEMHRGNGRLKRGFGRFTLPLLILHGTEDRVTMPSGSKLFHRQAAAADKTLKLYPGHYHDLLNDHGREEVLGDLVAWINARIPAHAESHPARLEAS